MNTKAMNFTRGTVFALAISGLALTTGPVQAGPPALKPGSRQVNLRLPGGARIVSVTPGKELARRMTTGSTEAATAWPYPRPPVDGFQPLVAATLSSYAAPLGENFEHLIASGLPGTSLNPPAATNYAVGLFDSGSAVDLIGYCDRTTLGLTNGWLTDNTIGLGGIGGTIQAPVTYPLGVFANGFSSILSNGDLDTTQLVGHGNVAAVAEPSTSCGNVFDLPVVLGSGFAGFFTTVIRMSQPQTATIGGDTYHSPNVRI